MKSNYERFFLYFIHHHSLGEKIHYVKLLTAFHLMVLTKALMRAFQILAYCKNQRKAAKRDREKHVKENSWHKNFSTDVINLSEI